MIDHLRTGASWGLMKLWNTKRTRWYYQRARFLGCHGRLSKHVGGLSAEFDVSNIRDYDVVSGPMFERAQIGAFLHHLTPSDVVYEVGGHIGTWSVFVGLRAKAGAVHVFEPESNNYEQLLANVRINRLANVKCHKLAVGLEVGEAQLGTVGDAGDLRFSLVERQTHSRTQQVQMIPLDLVPESLGIREPTAVKIDCEGWELNVLRGMRRLLASGRIRIIAVEMHPPYLAELGQEVDEAVELLNNAGYRAIHSWERDPEVIHIFARSADHNARSVNNNIAEGQA